MVANYSTPQHCPGFEALRRLSSFVCSCPECGTEKEIFSDEFEKTHVCPKCKKVIDFSQCNPDSSAGENSPR
jgi:hypothetical protein